MGGEIAFEPVWVGYISATHDNEIGIVLLKRFRGRGFGPLAMQELMKLHGRTRPSRACATATGSRTSRRRTSARGACFTKARLS
jgi:hypothetical protein